MMRIGFLGPRATFTEQALRSLPEADGAELVPCNGSPAVLAAVRDGSVDAGCVPIENTVEGAVPAVLDGLVADPPLVIVREALVAPRFAVLVRPGTKAGDVRGALASTDPAALAAELGGLSARAVTGVRQLLAHCGVELGADTVPGARLAGLGLLAGR